MKKLFVFGNEYLADDALAIQVAGKLKGVQVIHCTSPEELLDEDPLLILDVVKGAKKLIILDSIEAIKTRKMVSLHDMDLGFFLNLMKEMGMNKKIKIIGIPETGNVDMIAQEVTACL